MHAPYEHLTNDEKQSDRNEVVHIIPDIIQFADECVIEAGLKVPEEYCKGCAERDYTKRLFSRALKLCNDNSYKNVKYSDEYWLDQAREQLAENGEVANG